MKDFYIIKSSSSKKHFQERGAFLLKNEKLYEKELFGI